MLACCSLEVIMHCFIQSGTSSHHSLCTLSQKHRGCKLTCCLFASVIYATAVYTAGLQDLKELHLDRTLITDAGAAVVKGTTFIFLHLVHCITTSQIHFTVFTARCTIVQSVVLRSHVICPSVCDVGGSGPHRLKILETNCTNN